MTPDEQYKAIHSATFFTDLQTALKGIMSKMSTGKFSLAGPDSWLQTSVNDVPVLFRLESDNAHLRVGIDTERKPFYDWVAPVEWIG